MHIWKSDVIVVNECWTPSKDVSFSYLPLSPSPASQLPKNLQSSILEVHKHPKTDEVVKEVNDFFLEHWPFKTDKHRKRFVDEGYAWFVCVECPQSLDERLHWGCRLLILGFLIDDLLDRMSIEEGVEHNAQVIACARGIQLPDRSVPSQWIMYDLFNGMRSEDKKLANELLEPTIEFLLAQCNGDRMGPMNLQDYFVYRYEDLGKGLMSGVMRFCAGLDMTPEELALVKPLEDNGMRHITFVNDICSFEKELLSAQDGFELGAICSSVPIMMDLCGVGESEAKRVMWQMVRGWEVRHFQLADEMLCKSSSPAIRAFLKGLEYQMSGNELWSLLTPRYNRVKSLAFTEGR